MSDAWRSRPADSAAAASAAKAGRARAARRAKRTRRRRFMGRTPRGRGWAPGPEQGRRSMTAGRRRDGRRFRGCAGRAWLPSRRMNPTPAAILSDTSLCGTAYAAQASTGSGYAYLWSTGATTSSIIVNSPGGSYFVIITNGFTGCSVTDSATINVNAPPTVTLDLPVAACTTDGPLTLNGSPAGGTYSGAPGLVGNTFDPGV